MKFVFSVFMEELIAIAKVHGELDNLYELEPLNLARVITRR